eukprot:14438416-Ditylum_brightwellii.AAC.1
MNESNPSSGSLPTRQLRQRPNLNQGSKRFHLTPLTSAIIFLFVTMIVTWISFLGSISRDHRADYSLQKAEQINRKISLMVPMMAAMDARKISPPFKPQVSRMDTPTIIFTCNRENYLSRALESIYKYHPMTKYVKLKDTGDPATPPYRMAGAPIIVSQDGDKKEVSDVAKKYAAKFEELGIPFYLMHHKPRPVTVQVDQFGGKPYGRDGHLRGPEAYKSLSDHYNWGLHRVFSGEVYHDTDALLITNGKTKDYFTKNTPPNPSRVVILEEDIEIAIDFFSYMNATAQLLDTDSMLLAVSAFNDNGFQSMVSDNKRLMRSDFFPGLGWMLSRGVWEDGIGSNWPEGWWDDWLRDEKQRRGRHIIRPE